MEREVLWKVHDRLCAIRDSTANSFNKIRAERLLELIRDLGEIQIIAAMDDRDFKPSEYYL